MRAAELALECVLRLRSELGQPRKSLTDPARYIDARYQEAAMRR
jgi:hypothetical protein